MRGLSNRLTHVLVLTSLNSPSGVTPSESAMCTRVPVLGGSCWSLIELEPGGPESMMRELKKGKRLIFPGLHSWLSCSRESARNREIEREREGGKKDTGTQALMEQRCFDQHCLGIYTALKWSEVKSLSRVWLFATPWTVAYQAPQSMDFSRQEYWSGLPFPSPADLPNPGIEPGSHTLQADALSSEPPGKPHILSYKVVILKDED